MVQAYTPYRTSLIPREQLRQLSRLRPAIPMRDTLVHWVFILASWAAVALWPHPVTVIAAILVIGVNVYGLYIIAHDGLHRRLFDDQRHNDLWNDAMIVGSFGAITRLNRLNHIKHHLVTCLPDDPDRHKYAHDGKDPVFPFFLFLSGLGNLLPTARNIFLRTGARHAAEPSMPDTARDGYTMRDLAILLGWQAALIAGLTYFVGWWAYPLLWLLPVYLFAYRGDLTRVFCEHSMQMAEHDADAGMRLVTYRSNWLERLFFAPHGMNFHMPHHLWPSIPYYNLREADRMVRDCHQGMPQDEARNLVWRDSYTGYLVSYARWRLAGSTITVPQA